jgi:hypothetical protein
LLKAITYTNNFVESDTKFNNIEITMNESNQYQLLFDRSRIILYFVLNYRIVSTLKAVVEIFFVCFRHFERVSPGHDSRFRKPFSSGSLAPLTVRRKRIRIFEPAERPDGKRKFFISHIFFFFHVGSSRKRRKLFH